MKKWARVGRGLLRLLSGVAGFGAVLVLLDARYSLTEEEALVVALIYGALWAAVRFLFKRLSDRAARRMRRILGGAALLWLGWALEVRGGAVLIVMAVYAAVLGLRAWRANQRSAAQARRLEPRPEKALPKECGDQPVLTCVGPKKCVRRFLVVGVLLLSGALLLGMRLARPAPIPQALTVFAQKYPEAAQFVADYPRCYNRHPSRDISQEVAEGGVPLFIQWDKRWGYEDYGGNFLGVNGCGPTCLSMVVCALTGDDTADPYAVACYSEAMGYYTPGSGTSWALMTQGAAHYGLSACSGQVSADFILEELSAGRVLIASMKPGDFTYTGHFIVLTGLDEAGRVTLNDSNSPLNSAQSWDVETLVAQMKGVWSYSLDE